MGVCDDVGIGLCDGVFIFFVIEVTVAALSIVLVCWGSGRGIGNGTGRIGNGTGA